MLKIEEICINAKVAAAEAAKLSETQINSALEKIAVELEKNTDKILTANKKDISLAKENGIKEVMVDRLLLTEERIKDISSSIREVIALKSPVGRISNTEKMANGLLIGKMRVPMGVVAIIYESRPNVTADAAVLTLKAGNAVILRGGKEAIQSNIAISEVMRDALEDCGFDKNIIQLIHDTSRETATKLMKMNGYVDLLIPRGGAGLIKSVVENATVNVIETGTGNCHIFADSSCNFDMALNILYNAKTQRPSVCNAAESFLVHKDIAEKILPLAKERLADKNVEIRGCEKTQKIIDCVPATEEDFYTEYNDFILSVKVVDGIDEAIKHINKYGTHHSDCIVTNNFNNAQDFLNQVDSAAVYINASTRFTDGNVFGLGAEIGISTQKLHARGPMGLEAITNEKFVIYGNGQIR